MTTEKVAWKEQEFDCYTAELYGLHLLIEPEIVGDWRWSVTAENELPYRSVHGIRHTTTLKQAKTQAIAAAKERAKKIRDRR